MIAPGNHLDLDSLRAAPPARYRFVVRQIGIQAIGINKQIIKLEFN